MRRETIDFGIDLGTTNSSIAMWAGNGRIEVFKNRENQATCTPSAVYINKRNGIQVGMLAKNQSANESESENVATEFKQQMGRDIDYLFPRSGRKMKPEQLSAEVLKSLKADVLPRHPNFEAAVITIPAAFNRSEINATNKAAQIAGFRASPLCIEPVAAALAYGHQNSETEGFWLIFDFGGGTFDAAVVQLKDEEFQLVNHQGDNHLGGKLIDWSILDQILIPAVQKEFNMPDFNRQLKDPAVAAAIAKLKLAVEEAKVRLSFEEETYVEVERLITTPSGEALRFEYNLSRTAVNRMAEPYILRAIKLCKDALAEERLGVQDIDRVILVGGPTQMPVFRDMLADNNVGLGIPLEYSIDPMTVVAQGAAIFARTQKLGDKELVKAVSGEFAVDIELRPVDSDPEPYVGGKVFSRDHHNLDGFTIEFFNPTWRSGSISLQQDGGFITQLVAERGENTYQIQVKDHAGNPQKTTPDSIKYLCKVIFNEIPLTNNIGVAKADNTTDFFFKKGDPLPLHKIRDYRTVIDLLPGQGQGAIKIPLVEGSHATADCNTEIGFLLIHSHQVQRPVPLGSKIEFTLSIDLDQKMLAKADIPILNLDKEFEKTIHLIKPPVDIARLKEDTANVKQKLERLTEDAKNTWADEALAKIKEIEDQGLIPEIDNAAKLLEADGGDQSDLLKNRLSNLKSELHEIEDILEWPKLIAKADEGKEGCENEINRSKYVNDDDKKRYSQLLKMHKAALEIRDPDLLRRATSGFEELWGDMLVRDPGWWAARFNYIQEHLSSKLTDQALANQLFAQGRRSIDNNDLDGLKSAVRQLSRLLPREEADKLQNMGLGSSVI